MPSVAIPYSCALQCARTILLRMYSFFSLFTNSIAACPLRAAPGAQIRTLVYEVARVERVLKRLKTDRLRLEVGHVHHQRRACNAAFPFTLSPFP